MANVYGVQTDTSYGTTCATLLGSAPNSVTSSDVTSAYPGTTQTIGSANSYKQTPTVSTTVIISAMHAKMDISCSMADAY